MRVKKSPKKRLRILKVIFRVLALAVILPIAIGGVLALGNFIGSSVGLITTPITISGTGSMYPTFPKGEGKDPKVLSKQVVGTPGMLPYPNGINVFGYRIFGHKIQRGDIVVVENDASQKLTEEIYGKKSGWVKRVVAVANDTLELRDGIVYLNGSPLKEPYTAKPHSTFGEDFLHDCQKITVPAASIFVMGDNRTGSGDSREVGFFKLSDVHYVLPLSKQKGDLAKNWRDTSKDLDESTKIKLDKNQYLSLLNQKRKESGVRALKYQPKLELSAKLRGEVILKYDDFSFEATRSGFTMVKAMAKAGYSNIVYGEAPTLGYYEAQDLFDNQFEFPESKKFLLNPDFQEIGIAEVEGTLNGCPAQVIVQHFAGYVPPNYKESDIQSWRNILNNLNAAIPSWEAVIGNPRIDQAELKTLLDLLYQERAIAQNILTKMEANKWLTKEDEASITTFNSISQQASALADKLNGR